MNEEQLQAICKRVEAVPLGPWGVQPMLRTVIINGMDHIVWPIKNHDTAIAVIILPFEDDSAEVRAERQATAAFIAAARSDVPALLAEVDRLRAALTIFANPLTWDADTRFVSRDDPYRFVSEEVPGAPWSFVQDVLDGESIELAAHGPQEPPV